MYWLMRTLGFIGMALLGWAGIFAVYAIGLIIAGQLPNDARLYDFKIAFFGYGALAWIVGVILGLPSFFKQGRLRLLFLALPLALPVFHCVAVMVYFTVSG